MLETEDTAKEILEYCYTYLCDGDMDKLIKFKKSKLYKEMSREIEFLIDTD